MWKIFFHSKLPQKKNKLFIKVDIRIYSCPSVKQEWPKKTHSTFWHLLVFQPRLVLCSFVLFFPLCGVEGGGGSVSSWGLHWQNSPDPSFNCSKTLPESMLCVCVWWFQVYLFCSLWPGEQSARLPEMVGQTHTHTHAHWQCLGLSVGARRTSLTLHPPDTERVGSIMLRDELKEEFLNALRWNHWWIRPVLNAVVPEVTTIILWVHVACWGFSFLFNTISGKRFDVNMTYCSTLRCLWLCYWSAGFLWFLHLL